MKTKIKLQKAVLAIAFCIALTLRANAQTNLTDAYISIDGAGSGQVSITYIIVLDDTANVTDLEFQLGTKEAENDLVDYSCSFDINSGLPSGWSYSRLKNKISLSMGTFSEHGLYYGQARIKANGNWEDPFSFIAN